MDRRYNERIPAELPVRVTFLDSGIAPSAEVRGRLFDLSESGVSTLLGIPAEPGTLVKLEILGIVFYGHVAYCNPEDSDFRIGIFVEPALLDSSNLVQLVDSFLVDHLG